jgi:hypothetical protein
VCEVTPIGRRGHMSTDKRVFASSTFRGIEALCRENIRSPESEVNEYRRLESRC